MAEKLLLLNLAAQKKVAWSVTLFILKMNKGILSNVAKPNDRNNPIETKLAVVLPHQWICLSAGDLVDNIAEHHKQLLVLHYLKIIC